MSWNIDLKILAVSGTGSKKSSTSILIGVSKNLIACIYNLPIIVSPTTEGVIPRSALQTMIMRLDLIFHFFQS